MITVNIHLFDDDARPSAHLLHTDPCPPFALVSIPSARADEVIVSVMCRNPTLLARLALTMLDAARMLRADQMVRSGETDDPAEAEAEAEVEVDA